MKAILVRCITGSTLAFIAVILLSPLAYAQSSSTIAQSFKADTTQDFVNGALVSTKDNKNSIELATLRTASRLVGVIDGNPLVSLSKDGQDIEVVLSGTTDVLVSDINGTIKSGDRITVSPVAGLGMKATTDSQIIGTAQDDLQATTTRNVTDRNGKHHSIHIGHVRTQIGIAAYQPSGNNLLPPIIQNTANSIAGGPVSLARVLICSALLMLGFVTTIILVYTSTRSAMTSLGRNPLAARAIRRGLYQVITISLAVVGSSLLASYLILTI